MICSKATIQLKKYDSDSSTLNCKTYVKNDMLKVKVFKDIGPISVEFIYPKKFLQSLEQSESEVKIILKFETLLDKPIEFEPIYLKVDDLPIYAPIGYWHLVRQSSKFISYTFKNGSSQSISNW